MKYVSTVPENAMTLQELQEYFKVSRFTIWSWRKKKIIKPAYKLGRKHYFLLSELREVPNDAN